MREPYPILEMTRSSVLGGVGLDFMSLKYGLRTGGREQVRIRRLQATAHGNRDIPLISDGLPSISVRP